MIFYCKRSLCKNYHDEKRADSGALLPVNTYLTLSYHWVNNSVGDFYYYCTVPNCTLILLNFPEVEILAKDKIKCYECKDVVNSIVEIADRAQRLYGDSDAFVYKKRRKPHKKTYNEFVADSKKNAQFILRQKLKKGHVAVLGVSSYEWVTWYYGLMYAGLVIVPIDKELSTENIDGLIRQADVDFIIYDKIYADVAQELMENQGGELKGFCMDDEIVLTGEDIPLPEVDPDKLSAIVFTSGTTGKSKGVMLTQRNIARNVCSGLEVIQPRHGEDVAMSVLPMNHAFECTGTLFIMVYCGVKICICSGLKYLQKEIKEYKPTVMFVVPLMPQKIIDKVWLTAKKSGKEKKLRAGIKICNAAKKIGVDLTDKVLGEVKAAFGGRLRLLMCGGAYTSEELIKSCQDIGINLFQGYGLSECSPLLCANFENYHKAESVGKIVTGCEMKTVDGELWARGISVSKGYYNDEENTAANFEDGWFKTGDLGYIDEDNFVYVTGRKKNLIILSNGKNVAPEEIEALIYKHMPYVSEVVVSAKDDRIQAEIYLSEPDDEAAREKANGDIVELNKKMAFYKSISLVTFRDEPFPKTTTIKIIRNGVK